MSYSTLTAAEKAEFDSAVQANDAAARSSVYSYLSAWSVDLTLFLMGGYTLYGPAPQNTFTGVVDIGASQELRVTLGSNSQALTMENIDGVTPQPSGGSGSQNTPGSGIGQDVRFMLKEAQIVARFAVAQEEEIYRSSGQMHSRRTTAQIDYMAMRGAYVVAQPGSDQTLYPIVSLYNANLDRPYPNYDPSHTYAYGFPWAVARNNGPVPLVDATGQPYSSPFFQEFGPGPNRTAPAGEMTVDGDFLPLDQNFPPDVLTPMVDWAVHPSDLHTGGFTESYWWPIGTKRSMQSAPLNLSSAVTPGTYDRSYETFTLLSMEWVSGNPDPGPTDPDPPPTDPNSSPPIPAPTPDRTPPVPDGQPPTVKPMPRPITSSCKSTMEGPASCNFVVDPLPGSDFPKPGDIVVPDFSAPDFTTPVFAPMPVIDVNFPEMPPIGCNLPDFTNMSDCPPVPGTGGPLPGGRDRRGKRGINPNIKTGGKTHGKRRKVFPGPKHSGPHKRCFPAGSSCMGAITELLIGVGISPLDIVFQIGPEWDKQLRREKCFKRGVSRLDAAAWFASKLMCRIIDEGPPTHNVYIGPPHHRPGQKTWTFDEHFDLFAVSHSSTSEGSYHAVEVFGDHFRPPYPISLVENPFASPDESEILQIEVGPDYTRREAEQLAAFRAAALRRASVSVQASVPYSEEYMMRDRMILRAPDRGFQETYLIYGKQSDLSPEGNIHILTGVLPATARELEQFPKVK